MRLTELVSNMSATLSTQIAFVLFLMASAVIVYTVFTNRNRELFERARNLPLDESDHSESLDADVIDGEGEER